MSEPIQSKEDRLMVQCVEQARMDRTRFAKVYNDYYALAAPERQRVDQDQITPRDPADQDEIFDPTLQEEVHSLSADIAEEFTPQHRPWTRHEASQDVDKIFRQDLTNAIQARMTSVYGAIRESSFYECLDGTYLDLCAGPGAVMIRETRAGLPVDCEHVPLSQLLIMPGPYGGVGYRFWERQVPIRHLDDIYPQVDWSHIGNDAEGRRRNKHLVKVIEGGKRDWSKATETWEWVVIHGGKGRYRTEFSGEGSCPLIVGRISVSPPTAYGANMGIRALAPARTLNELAFLELKRIGKIVDPPAVFVDPRGVFNAENGMQAGLWYEAGEGFQHFDMAPQNDSREGYFKAEELRMQIKRMLFQDKPYQRGDTPPTAAQWMGEKVDSEKRKSLPRARIQMEFVLPVLKRFEKILVNRGELQEIMIDGKMIDVRPISPMSQASDMAEAQLADQFLTMIASKGIPVQSIVNLNETFNAIKEKIGDRLVTMMTQEEIQQQMAAAMEEQGANVQ